MAILQNPFFSVWASGSLGKSLTVKAYPHLKFVMYKHIPLHRELNALQRLWANEFTRRAKLIKLYQNNLDLAVEMSEAHFK